MDYSYLCPTPSENTPIHWKNPLLGVTKEYSLIEGCDALIKHQNSTSQASYLENMEIEHWWNRKWHVCLDYYLSSSTSHVAIIEPPIIAATSVSIRLPSKRATELLSPIEALLERKTHRKFQDSPLALDIFSTLLTQLNGELFTGIWKYYFTIFNVEGIHPGIYCYQTQEHGLTLVKEGLFREEAVKVLCGMSASLSAAFLVVLSIDIQEALRRFPYDRALREIYIDAGRIAQKLLLKGMQYQVGGLPSPAMRDTSMCTFLNLDPEESIPLYTLTMGAIPGKML